MNTGTPLDLTSFGSILSVVGILYWVAAFGALVLALRKPATRSGKVIAACVVTAVFGWFPATYGWEQYKANRKLSEAMAKFDELCKTAGPKIYSVRDGVEGIFLKNVRPHFDSANWSNQYWPDAGLPLEPGGDDYIRSFLYQEHNIDGYSGRGTLGSKPGGIPGYRFVETFDGKKYTKYRLASYGRDELVKTESVSGAASYSVEYINDTSKKNRNLWIASTLVKIEDIQTGKVMAEQKWVSLDRGQGNLSGFRTPWTSSVTCPVEAGWSGGKTRFFVDRVLRIAGEKNDK